jgi:hypothetical protein
VELQWRNRFRWGRKWGGVTGSRGDERGSGANSFLPREGRGAARGRLEGGGGARPGGYGLALGRRKEKGSWAERLRRRAGQMGQEVGEAWANMGISTENSNWAAKANGPN